MTKENITMLVVEKSLHKAVRIKAAQEGKKIQAFVDAVLRKAVGLKKAS